MAVVEGQTERDAAGRHSESHDLDALAIDQPSRLFTKGIAWKRSCISQPRGETHVWRKPSQNRTQPPMRRPTPDRDYQTCRLVVLWEVGRIQLAPQSSSEECLVYQRHAGASAIGEGDSELSSRAARALHSTCHANIVFARDDGPPRSRPRQVARPCGLCHRPSRHVPAETF